jgi:hypothetical protein
MRSLLFFHFATALTSMQPAGLGGSDLRAAAVWYHPLEAERSLIQ